MATRVELPALGQSMEEGTITSWKKREGDPITKGETLYEVMTDKANFEQESPATGILRKILVAENESAPVNSLIAVIADAGESIDDLLGVAPTQESLAAEAAAAPMAKEPSISFASAPTETGGRIFVSPRARRLADELQLDVAALAGQGTGIDGRIVESDVLAFSAKATEAPKQGRVTPLARAVAGEHGVDLSEIGGSGAQGKVLREDVHRAIPPAPAAAPPPGGGRTITLIGMRKMIADNVARSAQTAPHVTLSISVDMTEATKLRASIQPSVEKTYGLKITFNDIICKAAARALQDHPMLNSTLSGNTITLHESVHLGIAVSLGEAGLVVPVVRDAQAKALPQISREIKELAARAKEGKLGSDDMTGGTFTITNLGASGIESFTPIINPPQCAILGVCAIKEEPAVIGGKLEVRPMMNLCLSFDHRITDGAPAAYFLARLKEVLETPYLIFA